MTDDQLWRLDATAQAALIRDKAIKPSELADSALARIERFNPLLNAVITPLHLGPESVSGQPVPEGPFLDVPILVKDASLQIVGTRYCAGTKVLKRLGWKSTGTTEMARRLAEAGFVFLGKTNVPELSAGITTEPKAFGPTRNPWDLERTVGGSSGGSAAAVAMGMAPVAHGADGSGSLRYPAACCGVATLKPTSGRLPASTPFGEPGPSWTEFVLARSVRDLEGVFTALCPSPVVGRHEVKSSKRRVGLLVKDVMSGLRVDDACASAVVSAGKALEDRGYAVDESWPEPLNRLFIRLGPALTTVVAMNRMRQLAALSTLIGRPVGGNDVSTEAIREAEAGLTVGMTALDAAEEAISQEADAIRAWWRSYDLLVTPTCRQPAWKLGSNGGAIDAGTFPVPFSLTGNPALSLPLGWSEGGLPNRSSGGWKERCG